MLGKLKSALGLDKKEWAVMAPVEGYVIPVTEVKDPTFAEEMLGKGVAIQPTGNTVVAPFNGTVAQMFDTRHAVTLISEDGIELLIHIGLETVGLKGTHFTALAATGDKVKTGDPLITFDLEAIKAAGFDTVIPIVVCNSDNYKTFTPQTKQNVKKSDILFTLSL
jgi:PTS system beta-glucosides-specific IIC component